MSRNPDARAGSHAARIHRSQIDRRSSGIEQLLRAVQTDTFAHAGQ